jgi:membrane-bound metal-dependent hydrolase YbcI (DUF457 family)
VPSPIGHALGGLVVGLALARTHERDDERELRVQDGFLVWCVGAACVPDLDFAWGRHNMETHSVGLAVIVGAVVYVWQRSARLAIACALAVGTHVLFDWLGSDDFPPLGVMALWPFSSQFYFADAYVFATISRRYWLPGFIAHNVLAVAREVVLLGPIAFVVFLVRFRRGHQTTPGEPR